MPTTVDIPFDRIEFEHYCSGPILRFFFKGKEMYHQVLEPATNGNVYAIIATGIIKGELSKD